MLRTDQPHRPTGSEYNGKADKRVERERDRIEKAGDPVDIASDESFPASDPPTWTPVKGEKGDKDRLKPVKRKTS